MPKDIGLSKVFRKLLTRTDVLERTQREPNTVPRRLPYVDENNVVRGGRISLNLEVKSPSSTQRGPHDRRHASPTPPDSSFATLQPMPPSSSRDKGKAGVPAAGANDDENASPSRPRRAFHPYASVPQAPTPSIRRSNVPASSSRGSSSPSPLYPTRPATRHAPSASSSRPRPHAAHVATDSDDEQYTYNEDISWVETLVFGRGTRQDASGSRQDDSPLENVREPSPQHDQPSFQSFSMSNLEDTLGEAANQPLKKNRPAIPPKSSNKARLAQVKKSRQAVAEPSPALQVAAKAHIKSVLKERKSINAVTGEADTEAQAPARPSTRRSVRWADQRAVRITSSHPLFPASPPLRIATKTSRPPSPLPRPTTAPPPEAPSSTRHVPNPSEVKKTVLENRTVKYEWTDEEGPCSVIRPAPRMSNCERHARDKRAQRLWSIITKRKCGRIPSRRRLLDADGRRRQKIIHDPEVKKRLHRERMIDCLKRGGSRRYTPSIRSGLPAILKLKNSVFDFSCPPPSKAEPLAPTPHLPSTNVPSTKPDLANTSTAPPPQEVSVYPSNKTVSVSAIRQVPTAPQASASEHIAEIPRTPARKLPTESLKTPTNKTTTHPIIPAAPTKTLPSIIAPDSSKPKAKLSLPELVAELAKAPALPKPVVHPVIEVLHVEVEMDFEPPPQYFPLVTQPAPPGFGAQWPGPQPTYHQVAPVMQNDFMEIDAFFPSAAQWQGPPPPSYQQTWQHDAPQYAVAQYAAPQYAVVPYAVPQYTEFAEAPMDVDEVPIISPTAEIPPSPMSIDAVDYTAALQEHYSRNRTALLYVEERANWSFDQVYSILAGARRLEEDFAHSGVLALGDEAVLVHAAISGNLRAIAEIGHHDLTNADVLRAIHRGIIVAFRERMSHDQPDADPRVLAVRANLNGWAQGMLQLNGCSFPPEVPQTASEPLAAPTAEVAGEPGTKTQSEANPSALDQDRKGKGKEREVPDASSPAQPEVQSAQRQDAPSEPVNQRTTTPAPATPPTLLEEKPARPRSFYTPDNLDWEGIMYFGRTEVLAY